MNTQNLSVSVVIPAYNEELRIRGSLQKVMNFMTENYEDFEVLLVDDGSTDNTVKITEEFAKNYKRLKIIKNPHSGKGYTVKTGMLKANKDYILFLDADLATPIEDLKRFLVWVTENDFDIAIGSREGIGAQRQKEPLIRHIMGRVFNMIVQVLVLKGINDTQCGFKLFKKDVAHKIFNATLLYPGGKVEGPMVTAFDVEVLFLARKMGYKIKEVTVNWTYIDESKVNPLKDTIVNFMDVMKVKYNDIKGVYDLKLK